MKAMLAYQDHVAGPVGLAAYRGCYREMSRCQVQLVTALDELKRRTRERDKARRQVDMLVNLLKGRGAL